MDEHKQTCSIGPETPWSKKKILIILILMGTACIYRDQWGHVHTRIHFLIRTTVPLEKYLSVLRVLAVWDKLCCQAPLVLQ